MSRDRQRQRHSQRARLRQTHSEPNTSWRGNPYIQRTLAAGWDDYVTTVLKPANAGVVETQETRRAFHAGAFHLLECMIAATTDQRLDGGPALVEARRVELEMFAQQGLFVEARVRELGTHQPDSVMAGWRSYVRHVLDPAGAPLVQHRACRKAFFAGAHQMFKCFGDVSGVGVPEDEGAAYIEERRNEIVRFYADVQAGRA